MANHAVEVFTVEGVWERYALPTKMPRAEQRLQHHVLQDALTDLGIDVDSTTLAKYKRDIDRDQSGLSFSAFKRLVDQVQRKHKHLSVEELRKMLSFFDPEKKGYFTPEQFREIWGEGNLTPHEIEELMVAADRNLDGKIELDEFIRLMCPDVKLSKGRISASEVAMQLVKEAYEAAERDVIKEVKQRHEAGRQAAKCAAEVADAVAHMKEGDFSASVERSYQMAVAGHRKVVANANASTKEFSEVLEIDKPALPAHEDLQRAYAIRRAAGNKNNILPPGLASFEEGTNWMAAGTFVGADKLGKKWAQEQNLRGPLRDAYAAGFFGKGEHVVESDAAAQLYALGLWRRFDGNALVKAGNVTKRVSSGATIALGGGQLVAAQELWVSSAKLTAMLGESVVNMDEYLRGKSVQEMLGLRTVPPAEYSDHEVRWASCAGSVPPQMQRTGNQQFTACKTLEDAKKAALKAGSRCFSAGADGTFTLCNAGDEFKAVEQSTQESGEGLLWVALPLFAEDAEILDAFDDRKAVVRSDVTGGVPLSATAGERVAAAAAAGKSIRQSFEGSGKLGVQFASQRGNYGNHIVGHLSECEMHPQAIQVPEKPVEEPPKQEEKKPEPKTEPPKQAEKKPAPPPKKPAPPQSKPPPAKEDKGCC